MAVPDVDEGVSEGEAGENHCEPLLGPVSGLEPKVALKDAWVGLDLGLELHGELGLGLELELGLALELALALELVLAHAPARAHAQPVPEPGRVLATWPLGTPGSSSVLP